MPRPLGETQPRGRGIARADDGDRRQTQRRGFAAHGKERRGVVDHLQPARIFRLSEGDESDAERLRRLELALGVLAGMDTDGAARAAAAGKTGQRRQRSAGAAVVVDQRGNVRGPTLSLRMRQSQSSRCSSADFFGIALAVSTN